MAPTPEPEPDNSGVGKRVRGRCYNGKTRAVSAFSFCRGAGDGVLFLLFWNETQTAKLNCTFTMTRDCRRRRCTYRGRLTSRSPVERG